MFVLLSLRLYVRACVHVCVCVYRDFSPGVTPVTAVGILGFYPKYIGLAPFFFPRTQPRIHPPPLTSTPNTKQPRFNNLIQITLSFSTN